MRVLLVDPPGWQKESVNLGLALLAGSLKSHGHACAIIDLNSSGISDDELIARIDNINPDIVGFSLKTATANEAARLAAIVRETFPRLIIIAGGPHITLCADDYMKDHPQFDFAMMSEAEEAIVSLCGALEAGKGLDDKIPNLVWRKGGEIITNIWSPPANIDTLHLPSFESIEGFSFEEFRYPIVTSRGCPFKCTYCCVNKLTGSFKWRWASPERVVDELEYASKTYGLDLFEIWDDNFTLNITRAKEICRLLIQRGLDLSWYCHNGIRADKIDSELAGLMKEAGCTSIAFGVESGAEEVFNSIKKGEDLSDIVNAVKTIKSAGINAVGYYLIGIPGDTLETFISTVEFQRSLPFDHFVYGMLIPYPKTEVWEMVLEKGRFLDQITNTRHFCDDLVPVSFEMPEFSKEDMIRAYYISKYYELFKKARANRAEETTIVAYIHSPDMENAIAGMMIAVGKESRHVIVSGNPDAIDFGQRAFEQVPESIKPDVVPPNRLISLKSGSGVELIVVVQNSMAGEATDYIENADLLFQYYPGNPLFPLGEIESKGAAHRI